MTATKIWTTDDASFLRDRRSLYYKETILCDMSLVVVDQQEIVNLFQVNAVSKIPALPPDKTLGLFVFYDGGSVEIKEIEITKDVLVSITFKRIFPTDRDTIKASLYVPGAIGIPGQFNFFPK